MKFKCIEFSWRAAFVVATLGMLAVGKTLAQSAVLPLPAKTRILHSATESLSAGDITKSQLAELIHWVNSEPCRGVKMTVTQMRKQLVADGISKAEGFPNSHVLEYYDYKGWYVVLTDASPGDERYLLYRDDPAKGPKPVDGFSGAFTMYETTELRESLVRKNSSVPRKLADCIAWQVTLGQ